MFAAGKTANVAAVAANYIEDVFSTWLYTGAYTAPVYTQTITNGINLSTYGGLVWLKDRGASGSHRLCDTARGALSTLFSDSTSAAVSRTSPSDDVDSFSSTGFVAGNFMNQNGNTYVSWTFREQPKFFDVVTYTGNGASGRAIPHSLASVPGCMIVKRTNTTGDWAVYQRSTSATPWNDVGFLNLTDAWYVGSGGPFWAGIAPTSTNFYVDTALNNSGDTYVAYVFAHNAGGFGLTGTDNVISCGSFTSDGSGNATVNLGYEPQWILVKPSSGSGNWLIYDQMRGWAYTSDKALYPNLSNAELEQWSAGLTWVPTATGFTSAGWWSASTTYIYIAIRRGPMKVPTDATKVFAPTTTVNSAFPRFTSNFPVDWGMRRQNRNGSTIWIDGTRLTGNNYLQTNATDAEVDGTGAVQFDSNTGWYAAASSTPPSVSEMFARAPGFFDVVCYTGTGSAQTLNHNLTVTPELAIIKNRSNAYNWAVLYPPGGYTAGDMNIYLNLNTDGSNNGPTSLNAGAAYTASTFKVSSHPLVGTSGDNYVSYLFASCPGVSKVGSYTGTGATQTISCGFTGGSRLVLIKRTDSTGDWWIWDSSRGLVSGTDPRLALNSTAAEINANWVYATTGGFQIVTSDASINASGGSYIFLSVA